MGKLQDAVEKWEQEDPDAPAAGQLSIVLLSCKHFLKKLKESLEPCASMHHEDITARESFEQERRLELKEMVGKETLRYLVSRYKSKDDWFLRDLKDFVGVYQEASKLKGKASKNNPKTIKIQDRLSKLFEKDAADGRPAYLMDALPIWMMPTDLVSEMLPAKLGLFDLVILEEASQSDCLALPALLRGRQLVIIGDDKQMNPPKSHEDHKKMIEEKLGNHLPSDTRDNLLPGKSIFDLFSTIFNGPDTIVRLREHFRFSSLSHST